MSKKTVYDKVVIKVKAVDTKIPSTYGLVTKTRYDLDKHGLEKKIEDIDKNITNATGLDKNAYYNTKIIEIEKKIPNVTGFMTTAALNTKAK